MNTEIMVVWEIGNNHYVNRNLGFNGTWGEALIFAANHNFGSGVEVANKDVTGKVTEKYQMPFNKI